MSRKIYAVLIFKNDVYIKENALGTSGQIKIGDFEGFIFLPKKQNHTVYDIYDNSNLDAPENFNVLNTPIQDEEWGSLHIAGNVIIKKAIIMLEPENHDVSTLNLSVSRWLKNFHQNNRLFADDFDNLKTAVHPKVSDTVFYLVDIPQPNTRVGGIIVNISFTQRMGVYLSKKQFYDSCDAASQNMALNLEYEILLKSFDAYKISDFRGAVIEAGIALEISLTKALRAHLTTAGVTGISRLIKSNSMLTNLFSLAVRRGMTIASGYSDIINLRNKVVHKGLVPNESEASSVIKKTFAYLKTFTPDVHVV